MKIYLDLFVLQEVIITSLILIFIGKMFGKKVNIVRTLTISFFNSIVVVVALVYLPKFYNSIFFKLFSAFIVLKFGLNIDLKDDLILKILSLFILTFCIGGIGFFVEGNLIQMIVLFLIFGTVILKLKSKCKKTLCLEAATCFIEFMHEGKSYKFKGLVDTGHNVKSIYDEDIIFVKEDLFKINEGGMIRKRIVRYKTVSGTEEKTGMKIYNISITYGQRRIFNNAVIVSTPNILNQFDAIVGLSLIEGGCFDGNTNFDKAESKKIIS